MHSSIACIAACMCYVHPMMLDLYDCLANNYYNGYYCMLCHCIGFPTVPVDIVCTGPTADRKFPPNVLYDEGTRRISERLPLPHHRGTTLQQPDRPKSGADYSQEIRCTQHKETVWKVSNNEHYSIHTAQSHVSGEVVIRRKQLL